MLKGSALDPHEALATVSGARGSLGVRGERGSERRPRALPLYRGVWKRVNNEVDVVFVDISGLDTVKVDGKEHVLGAGPWCSSPGAQGARLPYRPPPARAVADRMLNATGGQKGR